jgi:adenosylcobinamide kinase/adenosylcobinamide-phosphate guanylyltransferase
MTLTLVTGGVRSGKSRYAEALLRDRPAVRYVAPWTADPALDPEWAARVAAHVAARPSTWETFEGTDVPAAVRTASSPVLVDCLGTWVTALVDIGQGWDDRARAQAVVSDAVAALLDACAAQKHDVVLVTNEVGWGVVPPSGSGRMFRDLLGQVNATVAARADRVLLVVAGRVLDLTDAPTVGP